MLNTVDYREISREDTLSTIFPLQELSVNRFAAALRLRLTLKELMRRS
jgi:hypothetical protein